MTAANPSGVELKFRRARKHLADLEEGARAYLASEPFQLYVEADPATGPESHRVHVRADPPAELGLILGDALHNARSGLDHAACELVRRAGGEVTTETMFPTARSQAKWNDVVRKRLNGADQEAKGRVRALNVYPGGDDLLWSLHQLDIDDKHKILIPVAMSYGALNLHTSHAGVEFPPIALLPEDVMFPITEGMEVYRVEEAARFADSGAWEHKASVRFDLAMQDSTQPAGQRPPRLVETAAELITHAEKVAVDLLEGAGPMDQGEA